MQMDTEVSEDERARNAVRNLFARQAVISADAYRRLLKPSIETEFASPVSYTNLTLPTIA